MLYSNFLTLNLLKISELYFCHVLSRFIYVSVNKFSHLRLQIFQHKKGQKPKPKLFNIFLNIGKSENSIPLNFI